MKFLKYITLAAIAFVGIACQEDAKMQAKPIEEVAAPVLNAHSDILINENNLSSEVTFSWSEVDCTAKKIAVGPSYATSSADTVCATFEQKEI